MFKVVVVCGLLFILISQSFAYVNANAHQCVSIQHCPQLYDLLKDRSQRDRADALIKQAICGYDGYIPKVWCPKQQTCDTPNGLPGVCKPLADCAPVYNIVNNKTLLAMIPKEHLQGLICPDTSQHSSSTSRENYAICCPSDENEFKNSLFTTNLLPDPDKNDCGVVTLNRITKGKPTELDEFPWTVLLHFDSEPKNNVVRCAGSLISERYVLTAAHCLIKSSEKVERVTIGEYHIKNETDCIGSTCADPVVVAYIEKVIVHPDWYHREPYLYDNDIALLRLTKPVRTTSYIMPICLPKANLDISNNLKLEIAGWGNTQEGVTSDVKQKAIVYSSDKTRCSQYYWNEKHINVGKGMFCALGNDGVDSCQGDSGGPIMQLYPNAKGTQTFVLAGIVSFGPIKCGEDDVPALYTQTSKFIDWIKKTIRP